MADQWTDRLSEYLDGELSGDQHAALETHLRECADCRSTLGELRRLQSWAQEYEGREPSRAVWDGVRRAIAEPGDEQVIRLHDPRHHRERRFALPMALAALLALSVVGAGAWWVARATAPTRQILVTTMPTRLITTTSPAKSLLAAEKYGAAIAQLEQALFHSGAQLDTATVRILQGKLILIDRAITEARQALAEDPASEYLADHFTNMMQRKLGLLRSATSTGMTSS